MSKIKLLILLLISTFIFSCSSSKNFKSNDYQYRVSHIGSEYGGLLLRGLLTSYLKNNNNYSNSANIVISGSIDHIEEAYITNTDNTSDREKITTSLKLAVHDDKNDCLIYNYVDSIDQFYIYASASKILSNKNAKMKIERSNTEVLAKRFINELLKLSPVCENN